MSKYGSASVQVWVAASPGGSNVDISQYLDQDVLVKITSILEPSHTFGDSWEEHLPVGLSRGEPLTLGGLFDTVATSGPHVIFKDVDDSTTGDCRAVVVGFGGGQFAHFNAVLNGYAVVASVGKLQRYTCDMLPTGAVTWTTSTS